MFLMFLYVPFTDCTEKVDLFLFSDAVENPKWIAHDLGFLFTNLFLTYSLYLVCTNKKHKVVILTLIIFAIFRVAEYMLWFGAVPMLPLTGGILIFGVLRLYFK